MLPSSDGGKPVPYVRDSVLAREHGPLPIEPEWGVYHASDIYRLVAWLQAGNLAVEAPLMAATSNMPLPLPPPPHEPHTPAAAKKWREAHPPPESTALDTEVPDAYAGTPAPQLPGGLIQPHTISRDDPPLATAVVRSLHAMLSSLLFWKHGHPDAAPKALAELVAHLERLQGATLAPADPPAALTTPVSLRAATIATEKLLCERGALVAAWQRWSGAWHSAIHTATTVTEVALAAATLAQNVEWHREAVLHRGSFHNFNATQHVPLFFPVPGARIAVVRSGLEVHLQRIRAAVLQPPLVRREPVGAGTIVPVDCLHATEAGAGGGRCMDDEMGPPVESAGVLTGGELRERVLSEVKARQQAAVWGTDEAGEDRDQHSIILENCSVATHEGRWQAHSGRMGEAGRQRDTEMVDGVAAREFTDSQPAQSRENRDVEMSGTLDEQPGESWMHSQMHPGAGSSLGASPHMLGATVAMLQRGQRAHDAADGGTAGAVVEHQSSVGDVEMTANGATQPGRVAVDASGHKCATSSALDEQLQSGYGALKGGAVQGQGQQGVRGSEGITAGFDGHQGKGAAITDAHLSHSAALDVAGAGEEQREEAVRGSSLLVVSARGAAHQGEVETQWPEPTEQQNAWLADLAWVESQAASLQAVEFMIVAAIVYVSGDIPDFKSRYATMAKAVWCLYVHCVV
jgi:hypothetical protein